LKSVLITGVNGFIGSRICYLWNERYDLSPISFSKDKVEDYKLTVSDTLIHLAGIVHQMNGQDEDLYFQVNHQKTIDLAMKARDSGVRQFIFMSTLKVYGLDSYDRPITIDQECKPIDPYGQSKYRAEEDLRALENEHFKVAIIRTPVVYGPNVKGNILRLMKLITRFPILPFGKIYNRRSMIFVDNLIAYIEKIIEKKYSGLILPADSGPYSTSGLVDVMSECLDRKIWIFSIPFPFRYFISIIKPDLYQRLFGSLELDSKASNLALEFKPPYDFEYGMGAMCKWFKEEHYD
jgi:UDP-glucose 4-epimerase